MKEKDIWRYIFVGTCLRFLQDQRVGMSAKSKEGRALENINWFLEDLDELGLHVTKRASVDLVEIQ